MASLGHNEFTLQVSVLYIDGAPNSDISWWRHQMETFSALLAICAGNSPVPGEFSAQRPVTRSFDVFFDLRLNKRLSKQSWGWCFETPSRPLWRHCNVYAHICRSTISRHNAELNTFHEVPLVIENIESPLLTDDVIQNDPPGAPFTNRD